MDYEQEVIATIENFGKIMSGFAEVLRAKPNNPDLQKAAAATIQFLVDNADLLREASGLNRVEQSEDPDEHRAG